MKSFNKYLLVSLIFLTGGCSSGQYLDNSTMRIIFFGDSITQMGNEPGGYVSIVRDSLQNLDKSFEVIGAGISGNKVGDLLDRFDRDVLSKKPDVVVIYIGINDVWHFQFADRGLTGTPKDKFEAGLRKIITTLQSKNVKVILCTPSVIGEKTDGTNKFDTMLNEYSTISRTIAEETGVTLCDLRALFLSYLIEHNPSNAEKNILTVDGVHPNENGNRFLATQMLEILNKAGVITSTK